MRMAYISLKYKLMIEDRICRLKNFFISDEKYAKNKYYKIKKEKLNLSNPETFSEKLQYLKLHYRNPLLELCADKYYCREYVASCGFENILKEVYYVCNDVKEIDLAKLPQKSFVRWNHMSGGNFIFDKKNSKKNKEVIELLSVYQKFDWYYHGREWQYHHIQPKLLFEEYLSNEDGSLLRDYKFYCFNGEVKYYMVSFGEFEHKHVNHKFDKNHQSIDKFFKQNETISASKINLPFNIGEMLQIAEVLSKPFPHVRVDMYNLNGRIVFGEMTFFSNGGFVNIESNDFDKKIGSWINIEKYKSDLR